MNFSQLEESVKQLANGRAYAVGVKKMCYSAGLVEWYWDIWVDGVIRMAVGRTAEAVLDDLKGMVQHPDHINQMVDPVEETSTGVGVAQNETSD
jgi:hypothetical protein